MSIIHEIHSQPEKVRILMWGLSLFVVLGAVGYFWLSSAQQQIFVAFNPDPSTQAQYAAAREGQAPNLLGLIGNGFGKLTASIGGALGFESSKGFDRPARHDTVHLLPLSQ